MTIEESTTVLTELSPLLDVSEDTANRLHDRLADLADREQTLDVSYRTLDTPIGLLVLAATRSGLVRVGFEREGVDHILSTLAARVSPRILASAKRLDPVATQLDEYFDGRRQTFEVALDFRLSHGFRRTVLDHLAEIGFGRTESYAQVAAATGRPTAVRAVGSACATNPLPIVVPCHRVLRSDGTLGGYLGGLEVKASLLRLEAA
jgi:methylated-DNA-[protein]-cysteine S-methyltransferase